MRQERDQVGKGFLGPLILETNSELKVGEAKEQIKKMAEGTVLS